MAALAVAQREADQALPVPRRLGAAAALGVALDEILEIGAVGRREEGEALEERMAVRDVGEDLDHARRDREARSRASGFVRSSASRMARTKGCEARLSSRNVSPIGLPEKEVFADRGVVVVARRIERIDIAVEPLGRERGAHGAAGLDDRRGELRLPVRVEGAGEAAGVDEAVEAGGRDRFGEALVTVRLAGRAAVEQVVAQRARDQDRVAAGKGDARAPARPGRRLKVDAAIGEPAGRGLELAAGEGGEDARPGIAAPRRRRHGPGRARSRSTPEMRAPLAGIVGRDARRDEGAGAGRATAAAAPLRGAGAPPSLRADLVEQRAALCSIRRCQCASSRTAAAARIAATARPASTVPAGETPGPRRARRRARERRRAGGEEEPRAASRRRGRAGAPAPDGPVPLDNGAAEALALERRGAVGPQRRHAAQEVAEGPLRRRRPRPGAAPGGVEAPREPAAGRGRPRRQERERRAASRQSTKSA